MGFSSAENPPGATADGMTEAVLPIAYRDSCAGLLISLNRCRPAQWYLPWKCQDERHAYEQCQYAEFKKRVAKIEDLRAQKRNVQQ